ncbi:MAG: VWA domain-containing protein [Desulfurococcaceae archaeon]
MKTEKGVLKGIEYESPLVKYRGSKVSRLARLLLLGGDARIDPLLAVDVYYSLYLPAPVIDEDAQNQLCRAVVQALIQTSEGRRLRARTILDQVLSTITAALYLAKLHERYSWINGRRQDATTSINEVLVEAKELTGEVESDIEALSRVRLALEGFEPGTLSVFSLEDYSLELIRLAKEADVRRILDVISGLKYWSTVTSRKYRPFKKGGKMGYELGSDVERMSPKNLIYGEDAFYAKLVQGRLLLYNKVLEESAGPIYVLLDKSGSMEGEKITWAKAVALALYIKAVRSRCEYYIRFFDSQPYGLVRVGKTPRSSEAVRVFEYVARIKGAGGTDITRALVTALSDLDEGKVAGSSIVLITDGIDRVMERPIKEGLKRTRASLITVMVKGDNKSLAALSKEYLKVVKLNREEIVKVVKAVESS